MISIPESGPVVTARPEVSFTTVRKSTFQTPNGSYRPLQQATGEKCGLDIHSRRSQWRYYRHTLMHDPDPVLADFKERGWREIREIDQALAEGRIDEAQWHDAMAALIKPAYLAGLNPYAQAGHSGDAETWEASRGFIADSLHRSGTFLDVGCASGILMESVHRWGARKNLKIEPHGVDIVPEFVQRAQRRLPHWADRIHVGNIRTWRPKDHRFDFVFIRPEYAPAARRVDLVRHILDHVLTAAGRLIVFVGVEETDLRHVESTIRVALPVHGRVEIPHSKDCRLARRLFWIDGPGR